MFGFVKLFVEDPRSDCKRHLLLDIIVVAEQFQARFCDWIGAVEERTEGEVIALDGKQLGRSHDKAEGKKAIY